MTGIKRFLMAVVFIGGVFCLFAVALNGAELLSWNYGVRNILLGIFFFWAMQTVYQKSLINSFWWNPALLFVIYTYTIPTVLAFSQGMIRAEQINPYYQIGIGLASLSCGWIYYGSRDRKRLRGYIAAITFINVLVLTNLAVYLAYFAVFNSPFTVLDMITALLSNRQEAVEFLSSHIGWGIVGAILFALLAIGALLYKAIEGTIKVNTENKIIQPKRTEVFCRWILIIGGVLMLYHWIPRSFPIYEYQKS